MLLGEYTHGSFLNNHSFFLKELAINSSEGLIFSNFTVRLTLLKAFTMILSQMSKYSLFFFCMFFTSVMTGQEFPASPMTESIVTCFPDTTGYMRITVGPIDRDYSDLQEAIDAASMGTVIILDAGVTFAGEFTLPYKGEGDDWVVILPSRMDLLPADESRINPTQPTGDLMFPTQADAMPKIVSTITIGVIPAIATQSYAHHYRLVGLEVTMDPSVTQSFGLVNLGDASSEQNSLAIVPYNLIVDRCYVHGHGESEIMKYGVGMHCADCAVIDSYISEFHSIGFDAQAIIGINGPGPFKIINNYLEAAGENILFGGGAPNIVGLVPSDIEIRQNYFYKPWSWWVEDPTYAGKHWTIKNLFELKTGVRVLFDGNVLENCWADLPTGQSGYAVLLTVRNENGNSPQADVSDVTLSNNIIRHVGAGISISGMDVTPSNQSARISVYNNLFEDINGPLYGDQNTAGPNDGTFVKIGNPADVFFDHNTILQTGPITWAYDTMSGFQYTNNLSQSYVSTGGYQGIYGPGQTQGNNTFAAYFPDVTDGNQRFHQNVLIGGNETRYSNFATMSQNYFPAGTDDVMFVDFAAGGMDYHNFALTSDSPYYQAGTDGEDIGVNFTALDSAFNYPRDCDMETAVFNINRVNPIQDIFPNPTTDRLNIELLNDGPVHYTILDVQGRLLLTGNEYGSKLSIVISNLPTGIYTIGIFTEEGFGYKKFVVE